MERLSLVLAVERGMVWTPTLCAGTVALAALSGLGLHVLVFQLSASKSSSLAKQPLVP